MRWKRYYPDIPHKKGKWLLFRDRDQIYQQVILDGFASYPAFAFLGILAAHPISVYLEFGSYKKSRRLHRIAVQEHMPL